MTFLDEDASKRVGRATQVQGFKTRMVIPRTTIQEQIQKRTPTVPRDLIDSCHLKALWESPKLETATFYIPSHTFDDILRPLVRKTSATRLWAELEDEWMTRSSDQPILYKVLHRSWRNGESGRRARNLRRNMVRQSHGNRSNQSSSWIQTHA